MKATATVAPADGRGLRRLAEQCGDAFKGGVVLHAGSTIKLDVDHCLAVPLARLCGMYEVPEWHLHKRKVMYFVIPAKAGIQ